MNHDVVREMTTVDAADVEEIRKAAESEGVQLEEPPRRELEPVTTVVLILIGTAVAVAAVMSFIERRKGGQVIDLRPGAPSIAYRDKGVTYGLVVILAADGTVTVEVKQPKDMFVQVVEALVKSLLDLGTTASAGAIAASASVAVGEMASVTTS
jgi:hypothetical protein